MGSTRANRDLTDVFGEIAMCSRLFLRLALVVPVLLIGGFAHAQDTVSTKEATTVTHRLTETFQAIQSELESPEGQAQALQAKRAASAISEFSQLVAETTKLSGMLESGLSLAQTRPVFLSVKGMRGNVGFLADGIEVNEEISRHVDQANGLLNQLEIIYE